MRATVLSINYLQLLQCSLRGRHNIPWAFTEDLKFQLWHSRLNFWHFSWSGRFQKWYILSLENSEMFSVNCYVWCRTLLPSLILPSGWTQVQGNNVVPWRRQWVEHKVWVTSQDPLLMNALQEIKLPKYTKQSVMHTMLVKGFLLSAASQQVFLLVTMHPLISVMDLAWIWWIFIIKVGRTNVLRLAAFENDY